ncbi:MAG: class I SAM-dependent methyltransferase [Actinomycetota bacterium]
MMIDRSRVTELWEQTSSMYDSDNAVVRIDDRLVPEVSSFLRSVIEHDTRVLDIGCGSGKTLLANADQFASGAGIDDHPPFIEAAESERQRQGVQNVAFHLTAAHELPFEPGTFDLVFSERGPMPGTSVTLQAALHVLKTDGMIFAETMGETQSFETRPFFDLDLRPPDPMTSLEQVTVLFARNGVEIRSRASFVRRRWYPDVYGFLTAYFASMRYHEVDLKVDDDFLRRLDAYVNAAANDNDELPVTTHTVWIGGVKSANPRNYWEWRFFRS